MNSDLEVSVFGIVDVSWWAGLVSETSLELKDCISWFSERASMWLLVLATTLALVVVNGQKRPTISFISGAGSGEVVTDLGKSAELICQVLCPIGLMTTKMTMMMTTLDDDSGLTARVARVLGGVMRTMSWAECP